MTLNAILEALPLLSYEERREISRRLLELEAADKSLASHYALGRSGLTFFESVQQPQDAPATLRPDPPR